MVSLTGSAGTTARMAGRRAAHHPHDQRRRGERSGGVVHEHEFRVADRGECEPNRLGAVGSARDDDRVTAEDQLGLIGALRRNRHDDAVDDARVTQAVERRAPAWATAQIDECLGRACGQPLP